MSLGIKRNAQAALLFSAQLDPSVIHKFLAERYESLILTIGLEHPHRLFEISYVCVRRTIRSAACDFL